MRVDINSETDYLEILKLESRDLLEIFTEVRSGHIDVLIGPKSWAACQATLKSSGLTYEIGTDNVGDEVKEEHKRLLLKSEVAPGEFSYNTYHRIDTIYARLDALVAKHSDTSELLELGETYEGRKIRAIRITSDVTETASHDKPMIWLDGGIHAREWVVPATMMYIIDSFLGEEEQDKSDKMAALIVKYQIVIAPSINPDGYEYSHESERLWRKNRAPAGCRGNQENWFGGCFYSLCYGIDLNRNWDTPFFGEVGVSADPCSLVYPGKSPFDQKSTTVIKDYLEPKKDKIKLFVTYHSYSQLFLTPFGYTLNKTDDHDHYVKVGKAVVDAIAQRHGYIYTAMRGAQLYPVSGDSFDWAYTVLEVVDSYCFELRPDGDSWRVGFELPDDQIRPTAEENVDGLLALIENIKYEIGDETEEDSGEESDNSGGESDNSGEESDNSEEESDNSEEESDNSEEESDNSEEVSDNSGEESIDTQEESDPS